MRRWIKSAIPRMGSFAVAIVTLGSSTGAMATVILSTDRSLFLSSNPIVSTETFDEFPHPTQFPLSNHSVTIDLVTYFDPAPNPGWRLDEVSITSSPPNSLFSSLSVEDNIITFDRGGFVRGFGFQFIPFGHPSGADARFHFLVNEINGATTDFLRSPPDAFLGFSSSLGIRTVSVTQESVLGVKTNFAFDDVSRSSVGLAGAAFRKRSVRLRKEAFKKEF